MAQSFAYDQDIINILGGDAVNAYGENNAVVPATETLLATYTMGVDGLLKGVYGTGETDGTWKLYVNSTAVWEMSNAWTQRNVWSLIEKALLIGDVIELKVTNNKNTNHRFTGGFYVYEL